jgi:hypothetical protein
VTHHGLRRSRLLQRKRLQISLMSLPSVMITSEKATQQSMTQPSLSVPNAPRRSSTQAARAARRHRHRRQLRLLLASFAFSLNETGSTFKCSLDGAPFYGQHQASAGARDHLQLERGRLLFRNGLGAGFLRTPVRFTPPLRARELTEPRIFASDQLLHLSQREAVCDQHLR